MFVWGSLSPCTLLSPLSLPPAWRQAGSHAIWARERWEACDRSAGNWRELSGWSSVASVWHSCHLDLTTHTHVPGRLPSQGAACIKTSDEANVCGIASGTQPTKSSMGDLLEKLQCKGKYTAISNTTQGVMDCDNWLAHFIFLYNSCKWLKRQRTS